MHGLPEWTAGGLARGVRRCPGMGRPADLSWQLRDYWLEYGVREPALEDDHPCLLLHSRGMGGEWQWLGRLPEEKSGDETHWHPSGALLLDALLQALAVAEPERAFALVELRLSVPRFSRCGPLRFAADLEPLGQGLDHPGVAWRA